MEKNQRKSWNENHKGLREALSNPKRHKEAVSIFLSLHSYLHASSPNQLHDMTLADEIINNLDEETFRQYPVSNPDTKNSIAWHLWHMTRIEDMTMNILVANQDQVLSTAYWLEKMNISYPHSGNDMPEEDIAVLSSRIDFHSLMAYREAVGKRTQAIITRLDPKEYKMKVDQNRVKQLFDEKAVSENSKWLAEYWSKKDIAGLFLMPATRHIFLHLNKCSRIKDRLQKNGLKMG